MILYYVFSANLQYNIRILTYLCSFHLFEIEKLDQKKAQIKNIIELKTIYTSMPIKKELIEKHISQFQEIPCGVTNACQHAYLEENRRKNRYKRIYPCRSILFFDV